MNVDLFKMNGGFYLKIDPQRLEIFAMAELSLGAGPAQITYGEAKGLIMIVTGLKSGDNPGVAGVLNVGSSADIGFPGGIDLIKATGRISVMFNTTLQHQVFDIPESFLPLLDPEDPTTLEIYAASPGLDGLPPEDAAPEIYVVATVFANIEIGGVITLTGYLQFKAAVRPDFNNPSETLAYMQVTGAVSTEIAFLGALSGTLNLNIYLGAANGIVGAVYLRLVSSTIPGVDLEGTFMLEINTFGQGNPYGEIERFVINQETGALERDGNGNLETETVLIDTGFRLYMYGDANIADVFVLHGYFLFEISPDEIKLEVVATMSLDPFGSVAVIGGMQINSDGLVMFASLDLRTGSFGEKIGITFYASAYLQLNTTGSVQTLTIENTGYSIPVGLRIHIEGEVNFLGFAKGYGMVDIFFSGTEFELQFALTFNIGGLSFGAYGAAGIYAGGFCCGRYCCIFYRGSGYPEYQHHRHLPTGCRGQLILSVPHRACGNPESIQI